MTENEFYVLLGILFFLFSGLLLIGWHIWGGQKKKWANSLQSKDDLLKHAHLRLEASETHLKVSLDFKEKIIKIIIHDLQSPLLFIQRISKIVLDKNGVMDTEEIRIIMTEIHQATDKCTGFITEMLAWIHSNQQQFIPALNSFELDKFIREKCGLYQAMAEKKGLSFKVVCRESHQIHTDYAIFSIVIRNLLDNAIKHTSKGQIVIDAYNNTSHQIVLIKDTGDGMSMDKIVEIETGVIASNPPGGGQLGFRIIHDMIVKLNGKIKIESAKQQGTTVRIELPFWLSAKTVAIKK